MTGDLFEVRAEFWVGWEAEGISCWVEMRFKFAHSVENVRSLSV